MSVFHKKNILIGVSGGIAAYKIPFLVRLFIKKGARVKVIMTKSAEKFVTPLTLTTISKNVVYRSFLKKDKKQQTLSWNNHIELAEWADLFIVAPATTNTIAKIAQGICDNLMLAVFFSSTSKKIIVPAMDLQMYEDEKTQENIGALKEKGFQIINPQKGELASGLYGIGRMVEPNDIVDKIESDLLSDFPLRKKRILITGGGTIERIDDVRYISNFSSGKMSVALAKVANKLGAEVTLITTPNAKKVKNKGIKKIIVESSSDMQDAVFNQLDSCDVLIMAAAVSDYKLKQINQGKLKKTKKNLILNFIETQDILKSITSKKMSNQIIIGFALEDTNGLENAYAKLIEKDLDFIVLNSLNESKSGIGEKYNKVTVIDREKDCFYFERKPKKEVAEDIFELIIKKL